MEEREWNLRGDISSRCESAPSMFVELCRSGKLDLHLQDKSLEAHMLLDQLLASEPKGVDGLPKDPQALRLAEERVLGQMLDFPAPQCRENSELAEPRPTPRAGPAAHLHLVKDEKRPPPT